jgi:hypothetical protein
MKKWKDQWKELLPHEKRFEVASWVLACAFIVFLTLDNLKESGFLTFAFDSAVIAVALMTAVQACEAVAYWRTNRGLAYSSIILAIICGLGVLQNIVKLFL